MSTTTQKKGKPVRLYILEEDEPRLQALMDATGLSGTMVCTLLLSAGIKACQEAGNRIPLPLRFVLSEGLEAPSRALKPALKSR